MRARSYAFVWLLFIVAAGILWLADVFTFLAATILGAVALGLILIGRIFMSFTTRYCVPVERLRSPLAEQNIDPAARPYGYEKNRTHYPISLRYH